MSDWGLKSTVACQVVLRNGIAIDAEVPDYSELDTVPNERRYTADQPSAAPSDVPPSAPSEASQALPTSVSADMPLSHHGSTSGTQTEAVAVSAKVGLLLLLSSASAASGSEPLRVSVSNAMLAHQTGCYHQEASQHTTMRFARALAYFGLSLMSCQMAVHGVAESSGDNIGHIQKTQLSCIECKTACVIAALVTETVRLDNEKRCVHLSLQLCAGRLDEK